MTDSLRIHFLGTGAASPSLRRGLPALAIQREGKIVLCDCGEGTQMQLARARLSPAKIHTILISHLHGDHIWGLPGFISSQQLFGRTRPLTLFGPKGLKQLINAMQSISKYRPEFPLIINELDEQRENRFEVGGVTVLAKNLEHSVPCFGFRLQEPPKAGAFNVKKAELLGIPEGRERAALQRGESIYMNGMRILPYQVLGPPRPGRIITYCTDTRPCDAGIALAQNCDVLLHDATFSDAFADRAEPTMHSTGRQAARVARKAKARLLALWHLSIRLADGEEEKLLFQAREEFANSILPDDLHVLTVERREVADGE